MYENAFTNVALSKKLNMLIKKKNNYVTLSSFLSLITLGHFDLYEVTIKY